MKKLNILAFLLFFFFSKIEAQQLNKLYLSVESTGSVYDVTSLNSILPTATFTQTPASRIGNIAIGYNFNNTSQLTFLHSGTGRDAAGNAVTDLIYLTASGTTTATTNSNTSQIGGYGTNNAPGSFFGRSYGYVPSNKTVWEVYPNYQSIGSITGDTVWNHTITPATGQSNTGTYSVIFASDAAFDVYNNIYTIVERQTNSGTTGVAYTRFLYRVNLATRAATQVVQIGGPVGTPIANTPRKPLTTTAQSDAFINVSNSTAVGNVRGLSYLNGLFYVASGNGSTQTNIYTINPKDGTSVLAATYSAGTTASNIDLAGDQYYAPFYFNCGAAGGGLQGTSPYFIRGTAATKTLRVNIESVFYTENPVNLVVSGTDITTQTYTLTLTPGQTYVDLPISYTGTGLKGNRTVTVRLQDSEQICTYSILVDGDADNDGVPDSVDYDKDNDGILDVNECGVDLVNSTNFSANTATPFSFTAPSSDVGYIMDIYSIDNSFNLVVNGGNLITGNNNEVQFQSGVGGSVQNVRFADGTVYGVGGQAEIYNITGSAATPMLRLVINRDGTINLFGSKINNGPLFPLQLYNGSTFNTVIWNTAANNFVALSQLDTPPTNINGNGRGLKLAVCDFDNDGIPNYLDTDSDNDGCPDAIEGSENVTYSMVNPLTAATNPGQISVRYDGVTAGTPSQIISTVAAANGVPQVVNNAINNTNASIGLVNNTQAGIADNTGASPVAGIGQGIGNSQNIGLNDCKCYKAPNITTGSDIATTHGVTAFNRAAAGTTSWPGVRNNGWTALESNTKPFVMNRMPVATATAGTVIVGEPITTSPNTPVITAPIVGMTFYDTTNNCLKINIDGTRTGWKCFNTQSCPDEN